MQKKSSRSHEADPALKELAEQKAREQVAEDLAFVMRVNDAEFRQAYVERKAMEDALGMEARIKATQLERQRAQQSEQKSRDEYPYNIEYLGTEQTRESNRAAVAAEALSAAQNAVADTRRDETLVEASKTARLDTLERARAIAGELHRAGVQPNVEVLTERTKTVTERQGFKALIFKGNYRKDVEKVSHTPAAHGWLLDVGGKQAPYARAVLCTDGRILTSYGKLIPESEETPHSTLIVKANVTHPAGTRKANDTFSGYLDERYESDITARSAPINSTLMAATTMLEREGSLQKALEGLAYTQVVDPSEAPTTKLR